MGVPTHDLSSGPVNGPANGVVVALVGAKAAPGATTSMLALALGWPRPVLVVDADLAGGDVVAGWLAGRVGLDRSLLSFAAATRHADTAIPADLGPHVVTVPDAPGVMVLPGLAHAGQAGGLDNRLWGRLVAAATSPWPTADPAADSPVDSANRPAAGGGGSGLRGSAGFGGGRAEAGAGSAPVDVLADCGRIGVRTPWPLLGAASVVLLATRPTLRGVHHARHALAHVEMALPGILGDPGRVGLLVCGPGVYDSTEVGRAVGLPVQVVLPADGRAADMLTDHTGVAGRRGGGPGRTALARTGLARAARTAAIQLAGAADDVAAAGEEPSGVGPDGEGTHWGGSARVSAGRASTGQGGWR